MYFWLEKVPVGKVGDCYLPVWTTGRMSLFVPLRQRRPGSVSGTGYSFADSLKSLRGAATTVIIAGFAVPTVSPRATVCLRSKYSIVAGRGHGSASGLLSCRAEKTGNKMRIGLKNWWASSARSSPDMPSRCLWGSATGRCTAGGVMQGRIVTCFATKHGMRRIMPFCIHVRWTVHGVGNACGR